MDIPYNWTVGEGKGWEGRSEAMLLLTPFHDISPSSPQAP